MSAALEQALGFLSGIGVTVDRAALSKWLSGRASTHADDLGLAYACARGDETAARHFERTWIPVAARALQKAGIDATISDDVLSWLRAELFAPPWCDIAPGNPLGVKAPLAPLLRCAMDNGRVTAAIYTGRWTDVGTPQRLTELNTIAPHLP